MPSFGEKLRLEREKRKITLDQVSSSTKIGTRMLQALEEDRFNQLPGGIFNKGFVRAYARFVGLDEDQTVADYLVASGDAPPVKPEPTDSEHSRDGSRDQAIRIREGEDTSGRLEIRAEAASRQLPWGWFAVTLLIVALALSLWNHRRREQEQQLQRRETEMARQPETAAGQPATPTSSAPEQNQTAAPAVATSTSQKLTPSSQSNPAASPNNVPAPNTTPPSNQKSPASVPKPPLSTATPTGEQPAAVPATPQFTLVILAHEESWVSITADGKSVGSVMLQPGDERTVRSRKEVIVRAGNSGALNFILNGKKLDFVGTFGEARTVTIGPDGLLPNTPVPAENPPPAARRSDSTTNPPAPQR